MQAESSSSDSQSLTAMLINISLLLVISRFPWRVANIIEARTDYDSYSQKYMFGFWLPEVVFYGIVFLDVNCIVFDVNVTI